MTNIDQRPYFAEQALRPKPASYPTEPHSDTYTTGTVLDTYEERREAYLKFVLQNPSDTDRRTIWRELSSMAAGGEPYEGKIFQVFNFISERNDCADFGMHSVLRLVYQFDPGRKTPTPDGKVLQLSHPPSQEVLDAARETILHFKYWPSEPGIDSMCTWTENHQILFASAAYLAGQLYPDETFHNSGETGREKMVINKPRILRWMDLRFRSGFSEWLSHVYYEEDLAPLLSLHDLCEDDEIRRKAQQIIDLMLLDIVLNQYKGFLGCSHGRSYERQKKWAGEESTITMTKLLFGRGVYSSPSSMSAGSFILSKYEVPEVLHRIFEDDSASYVNRQKCGFRVQDQARWGWEYDSLEDGMVFFSNEAYLHPLTAATTLKMFDAFNWWENRFFADFKPFKGFLKLLRAMGLLKSLGRLLEKDISRNMRDDPDVYTYKTPDYMLSTAQDHRKGFGGDQHHIWHAALAPDAVCFTTHPGRIGEASPNYWVGSGLLPCSVQVRNLNITLYNIKPIFPALYVPIKNFYTHAWLPKDKFDEVIEKDDWIFARKGDGYLALYSFQPYFWNSKDIEVEGVHIRKEPEDFGRDVIALGKQNVWITQLGRKSEDGPFEEFIQQILDAALTFGSGMQVEFDSPGNGKVHIAWDGPLMVDGEIVELENYPRYDNPYVQTTGDPVEIHIKEQGEELYLHWKTGERRIGKIGDEV
ncbi:MAG: hypothetical protein V2J07_10430 [Anaerolineae bacterium]|jgi:hypothetical protein|nr:hypothetical protein [Anaerolineae bacterium]